MVRGRGEGRSKKQAEAAAARSAWERLREELDTIGEAQTVTEAPISDVDERPRMAARPDR